MKLTRKWRRIGLLVSGVICLLWMVRDDMRMTLLEKLFVNHPAHAATAAERALELMRHVPVESGQRFLDVGCGTGAAARAVSERYSLHAIGIDIDPEQIALARTRSAGERVRFEVMDATRITFPDESFDIVATNKVMHHIPAWQTAFDQMARVLRRGGYLVYSDFVAPSWLPRLPTERKLEALANKHGLSAVYRTRNPAVVTLILRKR